MARQLGLDAPAETPVSEFGVEIPEELGPQLREVRLTADMLTNGNLLSQMDIPDGTLVMMVKRGKTIIVPNGQLPLEESDILLCISEQQRSSFLQKNKLK